MAYITLASITAFKGERRPIFNLLTLMAMERDQNEPRESNIE